MADLVAIEDAGGITLVRIQRPPANALSPELLAAGAEAVERLRELRPAAVVVTGSAPASGPRPRRRSPPGR